MSMNVVDLASYQKSLNLNNINYDGVAVKATEGNTYVNPYCDMHYQEAKAAGKKRAVYHFYDFGVDPITQANYFVNNIMGYIRDAILVLDWEGSGIADVGSALAFLQQVEARTGYKPAIYMSQWVENTYDWSSVVNNNNGLWIARYSNWELQNHANDWDMANAGQSPSITHWPFYFMWQWTSTGHLSGYAGNLDCDIAYLSGAQWDAYAGVQAPAPAPTTTTTTTQAPAPDPTTTTTETTTAPAPDPTTTTSTTSGTVSPLTTTTTTTTEVGGTTTETTTLRQQATWLAVVLSIFIAFIKRLQGRK